MSPSSASSDGACVGVSTARRGDDRDGVTSFPYTAWPGVGAVLGALCDMGLTLPFPSHTQAFVQLEVLSVALLDKAGLVAPLHP
jgi:hypothetical protein